MYSFVADFVGVEAQFRTRVDVLDGYYNWHGWDIGYVYGGDELWGIGYTSGVPGGTVTYFNNPMFHDYDHYSAGEYYLSGYFFHYQVVT